MKEEALTPEEIKILVDNSEMVYLVGDLGSKVQISGDVDVSNVVAGTYAVETEIGTVYLDANLEYAVTY